MKISTLCIVLSLVVSAYAACGNLGATSCDTCTTDYECVWCHTTSSCIDGDYNNGPVNATCPQYSSPYGSCSSSWYQTCGDASNCSSCTGYNGPLDCVWCQSSQTCLAGDSSTGPTEVSCPDWSAYSCSFCSDVTDCNDCSSTSQWVGSEIFFCGWCASSQTCMPGTEDAPASGVCVDWDYWGDNCGPDVEYCVAVEGSSSFCPDLPSMTCSEDDSPVDASDYNQNTYTFVYALISALLCPLHPEWVGYGKEDYCNIGSCSSDNDCNGGVVIDVNLCWDLCMDCQGNTTVCEDYVDSGLVAPQGDSDCIESFDELFHGSGMSLQFAPLMVLFLAFMLLR